MLQKLQAEFAARLIIPFDGTPDILHKIDNVHHSVDYITRLLFRPGICKWCCILTSCSVHVPEVFSQIFIPADLVGV
jgi:hypothetical protein